MSIKKASAVDPENWVGLLIDRALRKIRLSQSKALPWSGQWHNWHQCEISAAFVPHWRHFARKPVVASQNVMTAYSGYINWNYCWLVFSVVGLVNQPCLSVLLFLKFILQSKTAVKWVPCAQLYLVVTEKIMVCLATQVMMGIISTGITEGKGRAGVMIPIPGYSMYQARLLQHNTHQVIPIRCTWRRFPRSLF